MKQYNLNKSSEQLFGKWVDLEKIDVNYSRACRGIIQNEGIVFENELYQWLDVADNWLLELEEIYSKKVISQISELIDETRQYIESCEVI